MQRHARDGQADQAGPANVLIKYVVPPPVQQEFIEVFQEVKDGELHGAIGCYLTAA